MKTPPGCSPCSRELGKELKTMSREQQLQLAYEKLMDAAKTLAAIDDVQIEQMAEDVLVDAQLIDGMLADEA